MDSREENNNERHQEADEDNGLSVVKDQFSDLMRSPPQEGEKIEICNKAIVEDHVYKLSGEKLETDVTVTQIATKPLKEFNTCFQEVLKNSSSGKDDVLENFSLSLTGLPICSQDLETYNELCGPHIKSLELQISDLETNGLGSGAANHLFATIRILLENLENLHLNLADRKHDQNYMTTAYIFENIFSRGSALTKLKRLKLTLTRSINFALLVKFPALEELILLGVYDNNDPGYFPKLFTHLSGIRRIQIQTNPDFLNLKSLSTIGAPKDSFRSLMAANLSLEQVALSLTCLVKRAQLTACLNEYRHTLKSLKLLRGKTTAFTPFKNFTLGGNFYNLTELELWGNVVTRLEFLKNIPHLVKLKINYCCFECPYYSGKASDGPNVFKGDVVENSFDMEGRRARILLPNLQLFATDCKMSSYSWDRLRIWMPNLQVLEAQIPDNLTLLNLCDTMKKLRKLCLRFGSEIDDDGIVGGRTENKNGDVTYSRGIRKLKHLRVFELEVDCGQGKLTDKSGELGFLKLNHLETLKLGWTGNLLTEEMEKRLRVKIGHVEMYRSCSKTGEGENVQRCCKWADFKRDWNVV